ncbi:MAG: hypothetical protein II200_08805 [Bacteroidaceae bacterium]|nr:hypothetical protein [Bacteroidaceae bacterium]
MNVHKSNFIAARTPQSATSISLEKADTYKRYAWRNDDLNHTSKTSRRLPALYYAGFVRQKVDLRIAITVEINSTTLL